MRTVLGGLVVGVFVVCAALPNGIACIPSQGGILVADDFVQAPSDTIPRFCNIAGVGAPIVTSVQSGAWSAPSTWSSGVVPGTDARVQIAPGTTVTYDVASDTRLDCIEVQDLGALAFATDRSTRLLLDVLMVMPEGSLTIGNPASPLPAQFAAEIVFRGDTALQTGTPAAPGIDPAQYGKGLIAFGTLHVHGAAVDRPFVRFATEPLAGQTTLNLEAAPTGWQPGDRLIIPDTRQIPFTSDRTFVSEGEEVVVASIDGTAVTLTAPLAHDHRGPRDADGNVGPVELAMLPHVGNLTRNVIFRSENGADVTRRGHVIVLHRADLDFRYAALRDLGRTTIAALDNATFDAGGAVQSIGTNQVGRYSLHLHHLWGPDNPTDTGHQLEVVGNVLDGMRKWGMTIHDTHYGLFADNIAYAGVGSAIATEDGNEAYNVFERNLVVHTRAGDTQPILGVSVGRGGVFDTRALFGTTRDAFWFSGPYNYVRDNVAANTPDFAYNYNGYYLSQTMRVPRYRGANLLDPDAYEGWNFRESGSLFVEGRDRREGLPVLESARNEAYGATGQGLWLTWMRGCCSVAYYLQENLFEDYRLWHLNHTGVYAFHESRNTYDGFVMRDDPAVSRQNGPNARFNRGFWLGTSAYENGQLIIRNFDIQGFNIGIAMPPNPQDGTAEPNLSLVENGILKNHINLQEFFVAGLSDKQTLVRNVHFTPVLAYESNRLPAAPTNIYMAPGTDKQMRPMRPSRMTIQNFNGEPGNTFRMFWVEQDPNAVVLPPARPDLHAGDPDVTCPEEGLTNQECWDQYGVAVAGAVAPCALIDGDDCSAARARAASVDSIGLAFPTAVCGDGFVDGGEQCDDGNAENGDCCSATCMLEPSGASCTAGSICAGNATCDGAGICVGDTAPAATCRSAGRGELKIRLRGGGRDSLSWKWTKGAATTFTDLGDPVAGGTDYTLCVYDQSAGGWSVAASLAAPGGGTCLGKPCWKAQGTRGYRYQDRAQTPDGIRTLKLKSGADGKASIVLTAKGDDLPSPTLPFAQDGAVVAQLRSSTGTCFETVLTAPARRNETGRFQDKLD